MCEGGPPALSLGRLAELWRVIRMCEGGPTMSCGCGTAKGARGGRFWIGKSKQGEGRIGT
jgi:hypothetical protein